MDKDLDMKQEDAVDSDNEDDVAGNKKGRRKIKIEFIEDKSRRHITFSKRKAGIMKKAYELATLTGTQVLLLVASETGHVYTFATPKLQPLITKPEGKNLIQSCLNAPDTQSAPVSVTRSDSQASANGGYDGFPGPIAPQDYAGSQGSPTDQDDDPPKSAKPKRKARGKNAEVKQEQANSTTQSAALLQAQSQAAAAAQQAAAQQQALQAQQLAQQQQAAQQQQLLQAQQLAAQQQQANLLPQHIYSQLQGMQALPNGAMAYMPQVRMAQYPYNPAAFQQLGGTFVYPRAGAQPGQLFPLPLSQNAADGNHAGEHDAATQHAVQQLMSQTHAHDHSDTVQ